MDLIFENEKIEFNDPPVEEVIEKINDLLSDKFHFSHLIVDGEEIYEDPESYLIENISDIRILEVVIKSPRGFVNELLLTAEDYLKRSMPEMVALVDGFYLQPSKENWTTFSQMLEGMQWINQIISFIDSNQERPGNWDNCLKLAAQLQVELINLEEAVKNSDTILMADIIQYELLSIYETMETEIKTTIDTEGYRHDLS